ncbi:blue-light photoreceptor PHR2 [Impatiens glandulifera]|uniref:blue-light photoreceptor PHR2 n=1 Tax=Impatiens glandulifera TaxID=253017 RepID=UPI001FB1126F|nr:blue-light photoreceptor PHR2 [Impatiens glandulifera]
MDPKSLIQDNPEANSTSEDNQKEVVISISPLLAAASISLSLSRILPSNLLLSPPSKISHLFAPSQPNKVKVIPSQISSLSHLSLSSSPSCPPKLFFKSTISANPLQSPLSLNPRRPTDPSNAAGLRRASVVWFRNDLRVHDNECLTSANNESMSVLPVYCFDPRDYGKSSSGFDKTGPYRATFVIESVADLRKNLRSRGSDLVVRIGKPETVLVELAREIGAEAIYTHREVSNEEIKTEDKIEAAMKEEGVEIKYCWGSTLFHVDDLPFKLEEMPTNYGGFKEKVKGLKIRETIAALDQLKGFPSRGDVEPGEVPSLVDLGLNPVSTMSQQNGKGAANGSLNGGETEALQKLTKFAAECRAQPPKGSKNDSIYGANFSCKISPWLTMGCLSPRSMFDELKKNMSRTISAASSENDDSVGTNWLMYELMWRDFFRFITKKYSSAKQVSGAPVVTACTATA